MKHLSALVVLAAVRCSSGTSGPAEPVGTDASTGGDDAAAPADSSTGDATVDDSAGPEAPTGVLETCVATTEALCARFAECGAAEPALPSFCSGDVATACAAEVGEARKSVERGAARFDAKAAQACVQAVRSAPCLSSGGLDRGALPACDPVTGLVAEGAACFSQGECQPGLACDASGATCPGHCLELPGASEPCSPLGCAPGYFCLYGEAEGVCTALAHDGQPCAASDGCDPGLLCAAGTCVAPGTSGEACDLEHSCQPPLACQDAQCADPAALGAPCEPEGVLCAPGLVCAPAGPSTYACRSPALKDAPCSASYQCQAGLVCAGAVCAAPGGAGAPCQSAEECAAAQGLTCDPDSAKCAVKPGKGQVCHLDPGCADGLWCQLPEPGVDEPPPTEGTCTAQKMALETCASAIECGVGLTCRDGACGPAECSIP